MVVYHPSSHALPAARSIERPTGNGVRCDICEGITRLTPAGNLAQHDAPGSGIPCPNRKAPTTVAPAIDWEAVETARQRTAAGPIAAPLGPNRLPATGTCHSCGRRVSGERRFCGQCLRKRDQR